ncbi:MAG: segregation/condensation protein A [Clostridia bacterium]|nr:segregation/condensation protein A [Deltaproteobacteria bacterium]
MKRKIGQLLARIQNVVLHVWRRLFPETTQGAQLTASKRGTIRGFDTVTDAEYEDVTAVSMVEATADGVASVLFEEPANEPADEVVIEPAGGVVSLPVETERGAVQELVVDRVEAPTAATVHAHDNAQLDYGDEFRSCERSFSFGNETPALLDAANAAIESSGEHVGSLQGVSERVLVVEPAPEHVDAVAEFSTSISGFLSESDGAFDADNAGAVVSTELTADVSQAMLVEADAAPPDAGNAVTALHAEEVDGDATAAVIGAAHIEAEAEADVGPLPVVGPIRLPVPPIQIPSDYVPAAESGHAIYQLQLDGFEGPLDLLLHLIKRHHVDIFDIPVAFICEQYLQYLKIMEDLDIDVAAEFLFMASELLHLKSRSLLPKTEGETIEDDEVDPRAELVRRLLEYQKYKDAAQKFSEFDRFNRDIFGRDTEDPPPALGEAPLKEVGLFALVKAFESVLKRQKPEVRHQVLMEQVSVRARIRVLLTQIETITSADGLRFEDLLADVHHRIDIVVAFLALLEMCKLKLLRIFQAQDGVIYLHPRFDDVTAAFARLEGIDEPQYA